MQLIHQIAQCFILVFAPGRAFQCDIQAYINQGDLPLLALHHISPLCFAQENMLQLLVGFIPLDFSRRDEGK